MTCQHEIDWEASPGCANCYAEGYGKRFGVEWGTGKPRRRTSVGYRKKPLGWERKLVKEWDHGPGPLMQQPRRLRVFCGSLMDWLDPEIPAEWLADLLALIEETPHLDWLLLTKRPELWRERVDEVARMFQLGLDPLADYPDDARILVHEWLQGTPPLNVWLGATVEDQQRADERIPALLKIPARVRFLSCEPLLGRVSLDEACDEWWCSDGIGWVIVGGESGPKARPMDVAWARSLHDQCHDAGVPWFAKQLGGHPNKRERLEDWPPIMRVREVPR